MIQQKLAEVSSEAMVLLHSRGKEISVDVRYLRGKNEELLGQIDNLMQDVKTLKAQNEDLKSEMISIKEESAQVREQANREIPWCRQRFRKRH